MKEELSIEDAAHGVVRWRAVREHPGSAAVRYALCVALVRAGIEAEAEAAFREVLGGEPVHARAHFNLGIVLLPSEANNGRPGRSGRRRATIRNTRPPSSPSASSSPGRERTRRRPRRSGERRRPGRGTRGRTTA